MKILIIVLYLIPFSVFGQGYLFFADRTDTNSYDRIISIHEFIFEALNETSNLYKLRNTKISWNPEIDDTSKLVGNTHDWIDVNVDISLFNCSFDQVSLRKTRFKLIRIFESKNIINSFILYNCEIERLIINSLKKNYLFGHFSLDKSRIKNGVLLDQDFETCWINDNTFLFSKVSEDGEFVATESLKLSGEYNLVNIQGNVFPKNDSIESIHLNTARLNYLKISNCHLSILALRRTTVLSECTIDSTVVSNSVLLSNVNLNPKLTNIPWFIIGDSKITLADHYFKKRFETIRNIYTYNDLVGEYKNLHNIYLTRGDMKSANACFVEMKDIETQRMELLYRQKGSFSNWFNWRFNQFFKLFCNYGTSPVKALKISLYTILCFACIYFFFHSDWDRINRRFLMNQHEKIILYFKSNQNLEYEYMKRNRDEIKSYKKYKKEITKKTGSVPLYIRILGRPLYFSAILKHRINLFLYRRTDILKYRWKDLSTRKRIFRGSIVGVGIFFYLCYLVALKGFNSVFLSINAFSTLGFGKIPVNGLSRYVAIVEGFTGWFLLSVFSISLIG